MKKISLLFITALLALFVAACGNDSSKEKKTDAAKNDAKTEPVELTIKHQLGETTVTKNPQKVVVFDFGTLDTLDKLGVDVMAIPKSGNIPSYLSNYQDDKYENAGGLKEPDFEKIHELQPDLIIISGRQQDAYEELSDIAPTIYLGVDTTRYMESFKENATTIGRIFDKEDEVAKELTTIDGTIAQVSEKAKGANYNALILLANEGKVSAYGAGSRFGLIHDVLGVKPADDKIEASTHGQNITFEYVLDKNPDFLFVVDRGAAVEGEAGAKELLDNELINNTKAQKEGHIVYLNADYWYLSGGGLISVSEMVKEVEKGLDL